MGDGAASEGVGKRRGRGAAWCCFSKRPTATTYAPCHSLPLFLSLPRMTADCRRSASHTTRTDSPHERTRTRMARISLPALCIVDGVCMRV